MSNRKQNAMLVVAWALAATVFQVSRIQHADIHEVPKPGVFSLPQAFTRWQQLEPTITGSLRSGDFANVEKICTANLRNSPKQVAALFLYFRAQARVGLNQNERALLDLKNAVQYGLRGTASLSGIAAFQPLHSKPEWRDLLKQAASPRKESEPGRVTKGVATIAESNSSLLGRDQFLVTFADAPSMSKKPITTRSDSVGMRLREWSERGTAAGLGRVLYDNHDRDHARMNYGEFPQLTRTLYGKAARDAQLDNGLQVRLKFNRVTLGNSSTAVTGSPMWRSQPRLAYTNPDVMNVIASRFSNNHLYAYPEHKDHDRGRNGNGGYGDTYPANTPYMMISQGSSHTDKAFLTAAAATIAALRPEVFAHYEKNGGLFYCIQMILRRSMKSVETEKDYLSGIAHPVVMTSDRLNILGMVELAQSISLADLPPVAQVHMITDDLGVHSKDYFDTAPREILFDTPAAIARSFRSVGQTKTIRVGASQSSDPNKRPLTYHWVLLQGNPDRISITPEDGGREATISIKHHQRFKTVHAGGIQSNRVDIGLFVHNGIRYSCPAFISYYFPDHEKRTYDDDGRILKVKYAHPANGGNYVDPAFVTAGTWTDEYQYDENGNPAGWIRTQGRTKTRFNNDGLVVVSAKNGASKEVRTVQYKSVAGDNSKSPQLVFEVR